MKLLKTLPLILLTLLLTFLTQIGGLILIGCLPLFKLMDHKIQKRFKRRILKPLAFMGIYLLVSFTILPLLAKPFGRVPLPIFSNDQIKPLNIMTCVLNRHYGTPELLQTVESAAKNMNTKHPGTIISYLDANFPFIDNFPLFPHLSHDDGKKLDLTFYYLDSETQQLINAAPSFIGYGVYENPFPGEINKPADCKNKGYWHYSALQYLVPQWNKNKFTFDPKRTRDLIILFVQEASIGKVFIEPHLKTRMNLNNSKIRFHGCHSVRHDDHIHVQLK